MAEHHKMSEHDLTLPRRRFISTALASSAVLLPSVIVKADAASPEVLLLPTSADALVDIMSMTGEIERNILQRYYRIVGKSAGRVADKYSKLKNLVKEFLALAPELKINIELSYLRGITDVGQASALYINTLMMVDPSSINKHLALISSTSTNLNNLAANYRERQDSIPLSPQAVEKLREVIQAIADLNKPVGTMTKASEMLTEVSNDLRAKIKIVETNLSDAVKRLVDAELKQTPTSGEAPSKEALALAHTLRSEAVEKITAAKSGMDGLINYKPPQKAEEYFNENRDQMQDAADSQTGGSSISPTLIRALLEGTEKWVKEEMVAAKQGTHHGDSSIKPWAANSPPLLGWIQIWNAIRGVLENIIPDATRRRTGELWLKKKMLGSYNEDQQFKYFYDLLPTLSPPSRKQLDRPEYDRDRRQAATDLAKIR